MGCSSAKIDPEAVRPAKGKPSGAKVHAFWRREVEVISEKSTQKSADKDEQETQPQSTITKSMDIPAEEEDANAEIIIYPNTKPPKRANIVQASLRLKKAECFTIHEVSQ